MKLQKIAVAMFGCWVLSGCVGTPNSTATPLGQLVVAAPQVADERFQLEVAKLNEVLSQGSEELDSEAIGQLLYRRGSLYDALGLSVLARIDFNRALDYQPRLADAYNYLGIQYTQIGQYEYAYEALDAALELEPEHPYAYLNRGVAAYYDARFDLAGADLQRYFDLDPSDPYRAIWRFIVNVELDVDSATQQLAEARLQHAGEQWAWGIVDLYLGAMTEQEFLQSYATHAMASDETLAERMCEVYFYLGKYKQLQGEWDTAAVYFRLALTTNVHMFLEHRYAGIEMDWSQQQAMAAAQR